MRQGYRTKSLSLPAHSLMMLLTRSAESTLITHRHPSQQTKRSDKKWERKAKDRVADLLLDLD